MELYAVNLQVLLIDRRVLDTYFVFVCTNHIMITAAEVCDNAE
jgi:hypothetical protein